jgi:hypothetical protein
LDLINLNLYELTTYIKLDKNLKPRKAKSSFASEFFLTPTARANIKQITVMIINRFIWPNINDCNFWNRDSLDDGY